MRKDWEAGHVRSWGWVGLGWGRDGMGWEGGMGGGYSGGEICTCVCMDGWIDG